MPSNVLDLNNAFVYYLSEVNPTTKGKVFNNYLKALDTSRIQLIVVGTPTYTPILNLRNLQGTPQILATSSFDNRSNVQDTAIFNQTQTNTASFSVAVTEGIKLTTQSTLTAKIPFFVEAEISLSAEASLSSTQDLTSTDTQTFSVNTNVNVPPNSRIEANLVITSLRYTGALTANVRVTGQLHVTPPAGISPFNMTMTQLFRALKATPPTTPFTKTDNAGNKFSFTMADLNRFTVTAPPTGQVTYATTSNITSNFGAGQSVQIKQFDITSGQMVSESTL